MMPKRNDHLGSSSTGCWVDLFERPAYQGKMRRLHGPANYAQIILQDDPSGFVARSAIVGPRCMLVGYVSPNRTKNTMLFPPGKSIPTLGEFLREHGINSLELLFVQPGLRKDAKKKADDEEG